MSLVSGIIVFIQLAQFEFKKQNSPDGSVYLGRKRIGYTKVDFESNKNEWAVSFMISGGNNKKLYYKIIPKRKELLRHVLRKIKVEFYTMGIGASRDVKHVSLTIPFYMIYSK